MIRVSPIASVVVRWYCLRMRRSWRSRCLAVVLAVWFAFLVAEPMVVMHNCPMHDGVLAMHQMGGMAIPDMAAINHASPVPGSHTPDHDPAHHQCTCVGDCAGAAAVGLPSQHAALL